MATADHRGKEQEEYEAKRKKNKMLQRRATKAHVMSDLMAGSKLDTESLFKRYDNDGSGTLSLRELRQALAHLDLKSCGVTAKELLADMDVDGSGEVDILEFERQMPKEVRAKLLAEQAKKLLSPAVRPAAAAAGGGGTTQRRKVDKGSRPKHDDSIAMPWRTAEWQSIREEEQEERLSGKGTFVFGQRVPYHGEIIVPTPPVDVRRAAVDRFWHGMKQQQRPTQFSAQSSRASTVVSAAGSSRAGGVAWQLSATDRHKVSPLETDRQTDSQTDRQTGRQTDRQTGRAGGRAGEKTHHPAACSPGGCPTHACAACGACWSNASPPFLSVCVLCSLSSAAAQEVHRLQTHQRRALRAAQANKRGQPRRPRRAAGGPALPAGLALRAP
eukprot:SAG22_NODE_3016_length_2025_cov_1.704569_1_plen_385_part_10